MGNAAQKQNALKALLVQEFRICQALYNLANEERVALAQESAVDLFALVGRGQALLNQLGELESARRALVQNLYSLYRGKTQPRKPSFEQFLRRLDSQSAEELQRLHEGILAVMERVRELARVNYALFSDALERSGALQAQLISMFRSQPTPLVQTIFRPPGTWVTSKKKNGELFWNSSPSSANSITDLPSLLAAIVNASEALSSDFTADPAITRALKEALDKLNRLLEVTLSEATPNQPDEPASHAKQPSGKTGLVELIASLHRQERAYQAVLQMSNHILINPYL